MALLGLAGSGEHIVSTVSMYSGARVLFDRTFARLGVTVEYVWNPLDEAEWDALIRPETKAIFTETLPMRIFQEEIFGPVLRPRCCAT